MFEVYDSLNYDLHYSHSIMMYKVQIYSIFQTRTLKTSKELESKTFHKWEKLIHKKRIRKEKWLIFWPNCGCWKDWQLLQISIRIKNLQTVEQRMLKLVSIS